MSRTQTRETARTADNRIVTLRAVTVGQAFGVVGQVVARNGRVIAETMPRPYGMKRAAIAAARDLAATIGR